MDKDLRGYMAELVGTFALVFVAAATVCSNQLAYQTNQSQPGLLGIALAYGLIYAVCLAAVLPLSAGYLNPAVTVTLWACKRMDGMKACWLIFVQLLGAVLAGGLIRVIFSEQVLKAARAGTPHLNLEAFGIAGIDFRTRLAGIGIEAGLTFVLTFVLFATLVDPRAPRIIGQIGRWLAGLWAGSVVVAGVFAGFSVTGAAMNPARWFGTAIWETTVPPLAASQPFADHMVYWIGPILGSVLAGGIYTLLIMPPEEEQRVVTGTSTAGGRVATGAGSTLFRARK